MQETTLLRERLVAELSKYVQDENILDAFRRVPRHEFITTFYNRTSVNNKEVWCVSPDEAQWLEEIYRNRPLTTSLDTNGQPNVSSSQPDLMAQMMQSVQLRPGCRVLEVGTGTGYNAALLGCIAGNKNVVSIDINQSLLDMARERIERTIGTGITLLNADGRNLPAPLGLFDAIIVTGSHERFEPSWIKTLEQGGRIVFNWNKSFTKAMLEAEKTSDGKLLGRVCEYRGDFMHLHDGHGVAWQRLPPERLELIEPHEFQHHLFEVDFGFFLQIHLPYLTLHRYQKKSGERYYAVKDDQRVVQFFLSEIRGDVSLWEEIANARKEFERLGQPKPQVFSLSVDIDGSMRFAYQERLGYEAKLT